MANILADVLSDLAYTLIELVANQGSILLTSMLSPQTERVLSVFARAFVFEQHHHAGWSLLVGRKYD